MSTNDHNRGQRDGSKGRYKPPYSTGAELFDFFTPGGGRSMSEGHERNRDYGAGYRNGKK